MAEAVAPRESPVWLERVFVQLGSNSLKQRESVIYGTLKETLQSVVG